MDWNTLITDFRIGRLKQYDRLPHRPPWQTDFDRITFSSAFRRLQDKTQVFPLSSSDYVRTRLTHSMEVAAVGKSLGSLVGFFLHDEKLLPETTHPLEIGQIVSAATLAHDIGNPPFGHSGENSIRSWFASSSARKEYYADLSPQEVLDFENYEGNAQGLRLLSRLQMNRDEGGMQLTATTLAAFSKYPTQSLSADVGLGSKEKRAEKFGFFQADLALFQTVAEKTGMKRREGRPNCWYRHPLAFVVEAADDICYRIVDLEDAYRQKLVSYQEVENLLVPVIGDPSKVATRPETENDTRVDVMRSLAIGKAIDVAVDAFKRNYSGIMDGTFTDALLKDNKPFFDTFEAIKLIQKERVYRNERVLRVEATGFRVIAGLLEPFALAVAHVHKMGFEYAPSESAKIFELIPPQFIGKGRIPDADSYQRLLRITDYVCGMTDSYALNLFRNISGISLP